MKNASFWIVMILTLAVAKHCATNSAQEERKELNRRHAEQAAVK